MPGRIEEPKEHTTGLARCDRSCTRGPAAGLWAIKEVSNWKGSHAVNHCTSDTVAAMGNHGAVTRKSQTASIKDAQPLIKDKKTVFFYFSQCFFRV